MVSRPMPWEPLSHKGAYQRADGSLIEYGRRKRDGLRKGREQIPGDNRNLAV